MELPAGLVIITNPAGSSRVLQHMNAAKHGNSEGRGAALSNAAPRQRREFF